MANHIFKETQRINQWWLWLLLFGVLTLVLWPLLSQERIDPSQLSSIGIGVMVVLLAMGILYTLRLQTRIGNGRLQYRYLPFIWRWRTYRWSDIQSIELKTFNSLKEYGGWGIRTNFEHWLYNVRGNQGLLVRTKDKTFKLGTQKPQEAARIIQEFDAFKFRNHGG
jgi:hypothetical protein